MDTQIELKEKKNAALCNNKTILYAIFHHKVVLLFCLVESCGWYMYIVHLLCV